MRHDPFKALDLIRRASDAQATDYFTAMVDRRTSPGHARLPASRDAMRRFCEAIAYSQGARSSSVGPLIRSRVFRTALLEFDHHRLAKADPEQLLACHWADLSTIRFRGKIAAMVECAKVLVVLDREHGSFAAYVRSFEIPPRLRSQADIGTFWSGFDRMLADLRRRGMPFFRSTTSLLQLLLDLDFDSVKPDLIVMRLARRIGLVERETGDPALRNAVRLLQGYAVQRGVRTAAVDWYMLAFGGQTEAGTSLRCWYCPAAAPCRVTYCPVGRARLCEDFESTV